MPFTEQSRRQPMLDGTLQEPQPGDFCFKHYKPMVDAWKASPRWTTAHNLYAKLCKDRLLDWSELNPGPDHDTNFYARDLAWQVFFIKYVMPYEDKKEKENGTI